MDDEYKMLWLAKIHRMFKDATTEINARRYATQGSGVSKLDQTRAREYFKAEPFIDAMGIVWKSELEQDCDMAEISFEDVRDRARYFEGKGWADDADELNTGFQRTGRFGITP